MVGDFFSALLQELGPLLDIKDLAPDANNSCLLKLKNGTQIQLEPDKGNLFLVLGTQIGTIQPGRYRENIFREALKSNGLPTAKNGTFAYSQKSDRLIMFEMVPVKDLTGAQLHDHLTPFSEKAKLWQEAITRGDIPPVGTSAVGMRPKGMFGM